MYYKTNIAKPENVNETHKHFVLLDCIVLIVCALCPLYYVSIGAMGVYEILGVLLIGSLFFGVLFIHPFRFYIFDYTVIYLFSIIQTLLSCIIQGESFVQATKVMFTAFVVMIVPIGNKMANKVLLFCTISGMITGIYLLKEGVFINNGRATLEIGGKVQDPNWIALLFVIPFAYSLYKLSEKNTKLIYKIGYAIILVLAALETIITASRGAALGLVVSVVVWLISEKKMSLKRIFVFSVVIILFIIVVQIWFPELITDNTVNRLNSITSGDSRLQIWENLLEEYSNGSFFELLFGRGYGMCEKITGWSAHNDVLEQLFEAGLVGMLFHLMFWFFLLRHLKNTENYCGLAIAVTFFFESMFSPIQTIVYFLMPVSAVICSSKPKWKKELKGYMVSLVI